LRAGGLRRDGPFRIVGTSHASRPLLGGAQRIRCHFTLVRSVKSANAFVFGWPETLGMTSLKDVCEGVRPQFKTSATTCHLLSMRLPPVGGSLQYSKTWRRLISSGRRGLPTWNQFAPAAAGSAGKASGCRQKDVGSDQGGGRLGRTIPTFFREIMGRATDATMRWRAPAGGRSIVPFGLNVSEGRRRHYLFAGSASALGTNTGSSFTKLRPPCRCLGNIPSFYRHRCSRPAGAGFRLGVSFGVL